MSNRQSENDSRSRPWWVVRGLRHSSLKRFFLYSLVVSVLFGAVLGIVTVLRDQGQRGR